jgi:hypothetical protein
MRLKTKLELLTTSPHRVAPKFETVQARVRELFRGKTIVGHALFNDLAVS